MGADLTYVGTRFIATKEANADIRYKDAIVASSSEDIVYLAYFTGVPGNYLRQSILAAGLDPDDLQALEKRGMSFAQTKAAETVKAWRDIWSAGQSVGAIGDILPVADVIARMRAEYLCAKELLCAAKRPCTQP
jgi:nitronate monooxygenase